MNESLGGLLIVLGLLVIAAAYSEPDGPTTTRFWEQEDRDYWAPKCIDWTDDSHPYWYSDGSNMCWEYAKEWNYTTAAIGVLMIIGGIACFLDFSQISSTNEKITDESIDNKPIIEKEKTIQKISSGIKTKKKMPKEKMNNDLVNELKKLNNLKEQGILDDDEFKAAKQKIIGK